MPAAIGALIFLASLLLILLRPRGLSDWAAALGGGAAMALATHMPIAEAAQRLLAEWNVFLFFAGLSLASATARAPASTRARTPSPARWWQTLPPSSCPSRTQATC